MNGLSHSGSIIDSVLELELFRVFSVKKLDRSTVGLEVKVVSVPKPNI
jgi:hypothetical protein